MPVHDWTRVEAGIFHDFHTAWITEIRNGLNHGLLPQGYYALTEQHAGRFIPDVLALHIAPPEPVATSSSGAGGLALADAPPVVHKKITASTPLRARRRSLAIRHVSGHRLVALIEIVSPSNKDRRDHVEELATKVISALNLGVHVLLIDLFPPEITTPGACTARSGRCSMKKPEMMSSFQRKISRWRPTSPAHR